MPSPKHPALGYSLRGIMAFEITLHGPARDLHSGGFGGAVNNPAMALSQMLGSLRDQNGRITIPGFTPASPNFPPTNERNMPVCPAQMPNCKS